MGISLILPNIRSCHNVGAMFRTADAFGIKKLFLVGYTAHPPKPQIDKVSLGAETWVSWESRDELLPLLKELQEIGVLLVALEKNNQSINISSIPAEISDKEIALIVGNEVDGVSEEVLQMVDYTVHIPMQGKKESLNVSIAAGVAMYALAQVT
ncbi:TrmH family RNA methyltransferase [Patescibacteria group bacterium]|nr:TrmH family RNA methyltransferase [Patescibacteria group bacterium]MBU1721284.1 TrmH family RNA methyltransferase [Patescibacteria group bacterium]MBU1901008.1 TrmH family RNA methyltransferase [Patescibacteria group bacterium]